MASDLETLNKTPENVEEALAKEYPPAVAKPCNECPWRTAAVAGHLGPYSADTWLDIAHGEAAIACHKTIPRTGGWSEKTRQCRGAASFRANVCKSPVNPTIEDGPEDPAVFTSNAEFKAHHESKTMTYAETRQAKGRRDRAR